MENFLRALKENLLSQELILSSTSVIKLRAAENSSARFVEMNSQRDVWKP